jgi:hypothetical protein
MTMPKGWKPKNNWNIQKNENIEDKKWIVDRIDYLLQEDNKWALTYFLNQFVIET